MDENKDGNIEDPYLQSYFIIGIVSILCNFLVVWLLKANSSTYTNLLRAIAICENFFLFTKLTNIFGSNNGENDNIIIKGYHNLPSLLKIITFNYSTIDFNVFISLNYSLYFSMRVIVMFLSVFLCNEVNTLLRNPFSRIKTRLKLYLILSVSFGTISLILSYIVKHYDLLDYEKYLYWGLRVLFILFIFIGILSLFHVFIRFCLNKPLVQSFKNVFAFRHFLYVSVYIVLYFNENITSYHDSPFNNILLLSTGLIMFFIRLSEVICINRNLGNKSKIKREIDDQLTALISTNLNVEFMCCILYGLSEIFLNKKYKEKISPNSHKGKFKRVHSIKYKKFIEDNVNFDYSNLEIVLNDKEMQNANRPSITSSKATIASSNIINDDQDASIIEYCENLFSDIRAKDEITSDVLISSFLPTQNKNAIEKMNEGQGKSGSFFFHSYDHKFLIKTISNEELDFFLNSFSKSYHDHISNYSDSLITKIYGVYSIVIKGVSEINIMVMQNLLNCSQSHINRIFDLKGSSIKRKTLNIEKCKKTQALKDLDYQWITKVEKKLVNFTHDQIQELTFLLQNDLLLFEKMNIMDYSLLFIILDFPDPTDPDYDNMLALLGDPKYLGHIYKSRNMKYIYIIGIIDFLQEFNWKKYCENKYKTMLYGDDVNQTSSVDSVYYSRRFLNFMKENVFIYGSEAD